MSFSASSFEFPSSISSLVSPIRDSPNNSRSRHSISSSRSDSGPQFYPNDADAEDGERDDASICIDDPGFGILADSESSNNAHLDGDDGLARSSSDSQSGASGITIYSDAQESVVREYLAQESLARDSLGQESLTRDSIVRDSILRDSLVRDSVARDSLAPESLARDSVSHDSPAHRSPASPGHDLASNKGSVSEGSPRSRRDRGLVTVTPLRSSNRASVLSYMSGDRLGDRQSSARGMTTSYNASPLTPRLRRMPKTGARPENGRVDDASGTSQDLTGLPAALHHASPQPRKRSRGPLTQIDNNTQPQPKSRGINFVLGKPRQPSSNPSVTSSFASSHSDASTHASSQASSDGHLDPNRLVNGFHLSYIRRAGPTLHTPGPIYAGTPLLPYVTSPKRPGNTFHEPRNRQFDKWDAWGFRRASVTVSIIALLACTAFPPLWLLLGTGHFDRMLGPVPRSIKLAALALALLTLAAGTALVVVFSVLRW